MALEMPAGLAEALKAAPAVVLELEAVQAYMLVAVMQLALRHPNMESGDLLTEKIRALALSIQEGLGLLDPVIFESLEQGWRAENDAEVPS